MGLETGGTLISGIYLRWKMDGLISAGGVGYDVRFYGIGLRRHKIKSNT